MTTRKNLRLAAFATAVVLGSSALSGCVALLFGGAVVSSTLFATDRRSSGTQIDDQAIELKSNSRVHDIIGNRGHVSTTSYNRLVLLTGEVPTDADKAAIEEAVSKLDNVRSVVNELAVMTASSLSNRSNDALVTSKVKATMVDAGDLSSNAFKVVTERGIVYLMGRVTEREATRAVDLTRSISGVQKVVRVLEILTEAELAALQPRNAPKTPPAPVQQAPAPVPAASAP